MEKALKSLKVKLGQTRWFFDYDGSLCPHFEAWDQRQYDPKEIAQLLFSLEAEVEGILWNTGRRTESLFSLDLDFKKFSGYFIQGSVHWDSYSMSQSVLGHEVPEVLKNATSELLKSHSGDFRLEIKPTSLRVAPAQSHLKIGFEKLMLEIQNMPTPDLWTWKIGHRGAELLHVHFNKGTAISHSLSKQNTTELIPVAVGDDVLDRSAIEYCLNLGGYVFLVGENCGWVTEIKHQPTQVIYCADSKQCLSKISSLLKK